MWSSPDSKVKVIQQTIRSIQQTCHESGLNRKEIYSFSAWDGFFADCPVSDTVEKKFTFFSMELHTALCQRGEALLDNIAAGGRGFFLELFFNTFESTILKTFWGGNELFCALFWVL